MKLSNLIGTNLKERIKKVLFRYKNRNFSPYVIDRTLYDTNFRFYVADKDGEAWYVDSSSYSVIGQKEWLWPEMEFVKNMLCTEGDVVLECGGHHGLTALVISKWVGDTGRVLTFEPNPENVAIIQRNMEINATKNIQLVPKAIGAEPGTIHITDSSSNSYILKESEHIGIQVAVVTADEYLSLKPTILKIDVEGFEVEVFKGAKELLKTLPKLAIEVHPDMIVRYGSNVTELLSLIDERYSLWVQRDIYAAPVPYDRKTPITDRVHIFGMVE